MQEAIPYKSWLPMYTNTINPLNPSSTTQKSDNNSINAEGVQRGLNKKMVNMVSENAIILFARRGCCMGHVVRRLLLVLGVNPPVYEVDEEEEDAVLKELEIVNKGKKVQLPAVFIGGTLFGGLDRIMAAHISGELVPILKEAGALWL